MRSVQLFFKNERLWIILLTCILYFFSYAPVARNFANTPKDRFYWGATNYPIDTIGNLTILMEGFLGHWQRISKVTSTYQALPSYIKMEYILVGQLASLFHLDPLIMYYIAKFAISIATFSFIYFFIKSIFERKIDRIASYALVLFSTGIAFPLDWSKGIITSVPVDTMVFFRLTNSAFHYHLGILFSLITIYYFAKLFDSYPSTSPAGAGRYVVKPLRAGEAPTKKGRLHKWIYLVLVVVSGIITTHLYSPSAILVILSALFYFIIFFFYKIKQGWRIESLIPYCMATTFCIIVIILPMFYLRYLSKFWDYNTWARTEKMVPFNPLHWHYIFLAGITYALSVFSIPYILRKGSTLLRLMAPWVFVHPIAVYVISPILDINKTRFFMTPYFVIFAVLSVFGIKHISEMIGCRIKKHYTYFIIIILIFGSAGIVYKLNLDALKVCFCLRDDFTYAYPKKEEMKAFNWLRDNTRETDAVLSGYFAGMMIPAFAGNYVYTSWWAYLMQPPGFWKSMDLWNRFYHEDMNSVEAYDFLFKNRIAYVYYGVQEKTAKKNSLEYPFLEESFKNPRVIIYSVKKK